MNLKKQIVANITLKGHYKFTLTDVQTGEVEVFEYDNIVPDTAKVMIANNFVDPSPDHSMLINKAALGTGINPPDAADVKLQTEVYRNNLASKSNGVASDEKIAYATAYFNATEVTGAFKEVGIFAGGGSGADTGILVSRTNINITKSNTQTMTFDFSLTIN